MTYEAVVFFLLYFFFWGGEKCSFVTVEADRGRQHQAEGRRTEKKWVEADKRYGM